MADNLEQRLRELPRTAPQPRMGEPIESLRARGTARRSQRLVVAVGVVSILVIAAFGSVRGQDEGDTRVATDPALASTTTVVSSPTTAFNQVTTTAAGVVIATTPSSAPSPTTSSSSPGAVPTVLAPGTAKQACVRPLVTSLVLAESQSGRAWAVMDSSIGVTDDGGTTWQWGCERAPYGTRTLTPTGINEAWAMSAGLPATEPNRTPIVELVHTTDAGRTWSSAALPFQTVTDVDFVAADRGWAVGADNSVGLQLARTVDGKTWTRLDPPDPRGGFGTSISFSDPDNGWMSAGNPSKLYVTRDGGDTWSPVSFEDRRVSVRDLVAAGPGAVVISAGHYYRSGETSEPHDPTGLVYATTDFGATWTLTAFPDGTVGCCNTSMASAGPTDVAFILAGDVIRSHDGGRTWTRTTLSDDWPAAAINSPRRGRYLVPLLEGGEARVSDNAGRSWTTLRVPYNENLPG